MSGTMRYALVVLVPVAIFLFPSPAKADCPETCLCILGVQVLCEQSGLTEIPDDLPPYTEHLSLRKNQIRSIPPDAFGHLRKLKRLVLDGNQIKDIAPYAFRGLSGLEELSIQDNPLSYLQKHAFAGMTNITNLFLGYNKISSISMNAFTNTRFVRSLSLTGNPLRTIQSGAFAGMTGVDILYLPSGIQEIEPDAFNGLSNVSMLRLSGLKMSLLPQYAFRGLANVSSLNIKDSNITRIRSRAFYGMSEVDYLTLENNRITTVEANALQGVHKVGILSIRRNRIEILEPHALDETDGHVRQMRFENNTLPCDCQLLWVAETHAKILPNFLRDNQCIPPTPQPKYADMEDGAQNDIADPALPGLSRPPMSMALSLESVAPCSTLPPEADLSRPEVAKAVEVQSKKEVELPSGEKLSDGAAKMDSKFMPLLILPLSVASVIVNTFT